MTIPPSLAALVGEMLTVYGVKFTDSNSRDAAIESWSQQFLAALPVSPSAQEWRAIESAPKDGTWLVVASSYNRYLCCAIRWDVDMWCDDNDEAFDIARVTHWLPVPPLPAAPVREE